MTSSNSSTTLTNAPSAPAQRDSAPAILTERTGLSWWQAGLLGAVAATLINLVIWGVASVAGASLTLVDGAGLYPVEAGAVLFTSAVPIIVGVAVTAVIARWWPGVIRVAQVLGGLAAVGTLWGVFTADTDAATIAALTLMHLVSGLVVILALEGMRRRLHAVSRPE